MFYSLHIGNKHRTEKNNVFKYTFARQLVLKQFDEITLDFISLYYTWKNVKEEYKNNKLRITTNAIGANSASIDIIIPDGSYEISDINNYIHLKMRQNNDKNVGYGVNIYANRTYNRVSILTDSDHTIEFTSEEFRDMLGFSSNQIGPGSSVHGDSHAKIERVESIYVKCNLVYNDLQPDSRYMYGFVPGNSFGSFLSVNPQYPRWMKCSVGEYNYIEISLVDQDGRDIDVEDSVSMVLTLNLT